MIYNIILRMKNLDDQLLYVFSAKQDQIDDEQNTRDSDGIIVSEIDQLQPSESNIANELLTTKEDGRELIETQKDQKKKESDSKFSRKNTAKATLSHQQSVYEMEDGIHPKSCFDGMNDKDQDSNESAIDQDQNRIKYRKLFLSEKESYISDAFEKRLLEIGINQEKRSLDNTRVVVCLIQINLLLSDPEQNIPIELCGSRWTTAVLEYYYFTENASLVSNDDVR